MMYDASTPEQTGQRKKKKIKVHTFIQ